MSELNLYRGLEENLDGLTPADGNLIIAIDENYNNGKIYADIKNSETEEINRIPLSGELKPGNGINAIQSPASEATGTNTFSIGAKTKAGGRGYKITECADNGDGTGTYTLESIEGLSTNMKYSVRLREIAINCGSITEITDNTITVDGYPNIPLETDADDPDNFSIENYLTIVGRPDLGNIEIGFNAYTEGESTIAQDRDSHAEGRDTKAIGQYGHSEGRLTQAGWCSHAEGFKSIATGGISHAEGESTTATGNKAHAEGAYTKATNTTAHAEGYGTEATGIYSHAEGLQTKSTGQCSHAEGQNTIARYDNTHAEGIGTITHVPGQHVQGRYNDGGDYAHILGNGNSDAERSNAHTVDWNGNAWYAGDVRVGQNRLRLATEEYVNKNSLNLFVGEGFQSTQSQTSSAEGDYSFAIGLQTQASGSNSYSEGELSKAEGRTSHAEGAFTKATNTAAHAEGYETEASGIYSHAEGYKTQAISQSSHAEGQNTKALASISHVEGIGTQAVYPYQHIQGKYNVNGNYAHILGNGTSDTERSNAHWVDWDGNAWYAGELEAKDIIIKSSTPGSTKRFRITVDDSGTIQAIEI